MGVVGDTNLTGNSESVSGKPPLPLPRRILRMRSDAALGERFAAGDEAAFDVIYERHRPAVLAVCMGVLGTVHDAEDATQETFSSLSLALRSHPPTELRPWLTRVARNASIDTTRRRRHRLLTIDGEIPEIPARPYTGAAELSSVLEGIRELPEGQRTALLMRELGGHSYGEIATFLEVDENAVRGLIARARVGLRSYREATEFPCASARAAIEAEPDGRRHDKTVRRHLRSCSSCRSYRAALRGDAKALRAVFPWQAGGLAGSGIAASGAATAAKSAIMGVGLTQIAATCAASVCAVGAVGGVVFLDPAHRLFTPVKLSAKPAKHHHHVARAAHSTAPAPAVVHTASAPAVRAVAAVKTSPNVPAQASEHHHAYRGSASEGRPSLASGHDRQGHRLNWSPAHSSDGAPGTGHGRRYGSDGQNGGRSRTHGFQGGGTRAGGDSHSPTRPSSWSQRSGWSTGSGSQRATGWPSDSGGRSFHTSRSSHTMTSAPLAIGRRNRRSHGNRGSHRGRDR